MLKVKEKTNLKIDSTREKKDSSSFKTGNVWLTWLIIDKSAKLHTNSWLFQLEEQNSETFSFKQTQRTEKSAENINDHSRVSLKHIFDALLSAP